MFSLIDFFGIALCFFVVFLLGLKHRAIAIALFVGCVLRVSAMVLNQYGLLHLPGSNADARRFERIATNWSELSWNELFQVFNLGTSYVYSWLAAVFYKITMPSAMWLISINIILGLLAILATYKIALYFCSKKRATLLAWICALFPMMIAHSATSLREMVIVTPFAFACYYTLKWVNEKNTLHLILAFLLFSIASVFHGGITAAIGGLLIVVIWETFFPDRESRSRGRVRSTVNGVIGLSLIVTLVVLVLTSQVRLSSVGHLDDAVFDFGETIEDRFVRDARGGSAYPAGIATANPWTSPWVIPARVAYFLFSPFPWDIRAISHLQGVIPALVYLWAFISIWRSRKHVSHRRAYLSLLIIIGLVAFTFALGTTNVGTSLRHRTKIFAVMIALCAAPVLKSLRRLVK